MSTSVEPATTSTPPATAPTLVQKLTAEAIGTGILVLVACGVGAVTGDLLATGLAFGLTVMVLIYAFGRISGGHFNPAVSVGAALGGRISWRDAGAYAGAQVVGAVLGALVLAIVLLGTDGYEFFDESTPLGTNGYSEGGYDYAAWAAVLVELVMTAIFVLVILAVTDTRNEHPGLAPLAIGFTLVVIHFALIPLTGTSVNPARSIGPALLSGPDWIAQLWPFIIGPLLGGALAGLAYPAVFGRDNDPVPGSGFRFSPKPAQGAYGAPDQFQQQWNQPVGGGSGGGYAGDQGYSQPGAYTPSAQGTPQHQAAAGQHAQPVQYQEQYQQDQSAHVHPVAEQPIIQDGWQWDPHAQQWIPAQQQPPAGQGQSGWAAPGGTDQTQVRPQDGY